MIYFSSIISNYYIQFLSPIKLIETPSAMLRWLHPWTAPCARHGWTGERSGWWYETCPEWHPCSLMSFCAPVVFLRNKPRFFLSRRKCQIAFNLTTSCSGFLINTSYFYLIICQKVFHYFWKIKVFKISSALFLSSDGYRSSPIGWCQTVDLDIKVSYSSSWKIFLVTYKLE